MRLNFLLLFSSLSILSDSRCEYHSIEEEISEVQIVGKDLPNVKSLVPVTSYEERLEFEGSLGELKLIMRVLTIFMKMNQFLIYQCFQHLMVK